MKLNWLQSAMMGFVSGLAEPLPLSGEAHRGLLRQLFGIQSEGPLFLLACHLAVLVVVLLTGRLELNRLRRTRRLMPNKMIVLLFPAQAVVILILKCPLNFGINSVVNFLLKLKVLRADILVLKSVTVE